MRRSDVPVFACLLLLVASNGVQLARASSTIDLEASNGATVCPVAPFYGVWNSTSSTCFITGAVSFASGSTVQIGSNVTLNVEQEGSISLSGALEAGGTVYDYGGIIIGSTGSLVASGNFGVQIGATLDNFGLINDTQNGMPVWGVLTNEAGGEIYVSSTGGMASLGVIANYGTVLNHGHFDAKPISEPLTTPGDIENFASVVNLNSISIGGRFTNEGDGVVVNSASGTGQGFSIACFTPEEFPGILATCGSFTNDGTFNNTSTGGMSVISNVTAINSGEMSNGGTLNVYSVFNNTATISNTGSIGIGPNGTINNEAGGSVDNSGSIVVQCSGSALLGQFNNLGTLTGNQVAAAQGCQVSSSATLSNGAATVDQTSTGVEVEVSGSTAPDGTVVTIKSESLGSSQPQGTGTIGAGQAFYDVSVSGISDGSALVCITNNSVTSLTVLQYWTGTSWVAAEGQSVSGDQVCGGIGVTALSGTPIAVGPSAATTSTTSSTITTSVTTSTSTSYSATVNETTSSESTTTTSATGSSATTSSTESSSAQSSTTSSSSTQSVSSTYSTTVTPIATTTSSRSSQSSSTSSNQPTGLQLSLLVVAVLAVIIAAALWVRRKSMLGAPTVKGSPGTASQVGRFLVPFLIAELVK